MPPKRKLYIIATPLGNLGDLTYRAREILESVPVVICEDTRQTKKLLAHYDITNKKLISYHQHSKDNKLTQVISLIDQFDLAYVSDAGTPGISDPGGKLIAGLFGEFGDSLSVIPIPGPAAVIAALSISGFPTDSFYFAGFIPHKKGRQTFLNKLEDSKVTVVFYESVHRILKLLDELNQFIPDRPMVLARELTKKFETVYRGTAQEIKERLLSDEIKGEFVVVIRRKK